MSMDRSLLRPTGWARLADFLQLMRLTDPGMAADVANAVGAVGRVRGRARPRCTADFYCRGICDARRRLLVNDYADATSMAM